MASEKFDPIDNISCVEIRLECLRLATEFGVENDRRDPLPIAQSYYDWATIDNSKRKLCICKTSKKEVQLETIKPKKRS